MFSLGLMYHEGKVKDVPKDVQQAMAWYRKAAEQGVARAQYNLGVMYANGEGVPKDEQQAMLWYRKAAEQGVARAQYNLGVMYDNGRGATKDEQQAYFWWLLASAQGHQGAANNRDIQERLLTTEQRAFAQAAARGWKAKTAAQANAIASANSMDGLVPAPHSTSAVASAQPDSTGSGFRVARGVIVTNHHVISGCGRLSVNGVVAQLRSSDARSDLALLNSTVPGPAPSCALDVSLSVNRLLSRVIRCAVCSRVST